MHHYGVFRRLLGGCAGEDGKMTEIDYQKDVREPMFVRCRGCEHEWICMYMPMHITRAASILQGLRCPNCGNYSASIFIKAKEETDG